MEYKSQNGQDKWVLDNLFHNMQYGFFVDVGAGDGVVLSNTWTMEKELRWEGICIEPHNEAYAALRANRDCITYNKVVMDYNGDVEFKQYPMDAGFCSYFSTVGTPQLHKPSETVTKPCETLFTILEKLRCPSLIHYLSMDTEDSEYLILKKFFEEEASNTGWVRHRIISLSAECHRPEQEAALTKLLAQHNYKKIAKVGLDHFYLHNAYDVLWHENT